MTSLIVERFRETVGGITSAEASSILEACDWDIKAALARCRRDGVGIVGSLGSAARATSANTPPAAEATAAAPAAEAATPPPPAFDCFLTHDWGDDEEGRGNHDRVGRVSAALKAAGLRPWFDEERMQGDINQRMVEGIEGSSSVVCFITRRYLEKAWGKGPAGDDDNCKFEFDYACRRKGVAKMISVVMERGCRNPSGWAGTVGGKLGGKLYIDLSSDDAAAFDAGVRLLVGEVRLLMAGPS